MLGAIIGDIVGSRFEFRNNKSKEFELFNNKCTFTDDTVMTLAISKSVLNAKEDYSDLSYQSVKSMQEMARKYSRAGYGMRFIQWMLSSNPKPYNSFGNGAAMRVSAIGFIANTIDETIDLSRKVTEVTHNHPEGIKGAEATSVSIFLAKNGYKINEIRDYIDKHYYKLDFKLDDIRKSYKTDVTCQGTVPQAITAFLESTDFEDAIRNAISIGGDSDTIAAITGGIAEAYYGVPVEIRENALKYLDENLKSILLEFENNFSD